MASEVLAEIKSRVRLLTHQEQLRLMEHLARELREEDARSQKLFEEGLVAMAADPDIQREMKSINSET